MERHHIRNLRIMLAFLVIIYIYAMYILYNPSTLSKEAMQYKFSAETVLSGFSFRVIGVGIFYLFGIVFGVLSVIYLYIGKRKGIIFLVLSPFFLVLTAIMARFEAAYPDTYEVRTILMWCACSAVWGCTFMYALMIREKLS